MLGIHGKASSRSARARCLALLLVAGAIVAPRDARAVPPGASNAAALGRFEEGKKAFDSGKFEEALIAFQASQSLLPSPNSRLYIARCYRALGKVASAYTNFRLASREAQDRLGATGEKRYSATRDAAASEAAEIEPKVPRLTLAVASDLPDGFVVKVDGAEILKAAWGTAIETDPGEHTVEASGPRLSPFSKSVSLKEGAQVRIAVEATRLPTASIAMRFATRPAGLAMELDGRPLDANAAEARRETDVGVHRIVVHAPGYKDFVWEKSLDDHGDEVVDVHLEPDSRSHARQRPTEVALLRCRRPRRRERGRRNDLRCTRLEHRERRDRQGPAAARPGGARRREIRGHEGERILHCRRGARCRRRCALLLDRLEERGRKEARRALRAVDRPQRGRGRRARKLR